MRTTPTKVDNAHENDDDDDTNDTMPDVLYGAHTTQLYYNLGQNVLGHITKIPLFPCAPWQKWKPSPNE